MEDRKEIFSRMNPQPCGACSARNQTCPVGCFFAQYFKEVGDDKKFRVLLRGNLDDSKVEELRKAIVKTRIASRQSYIDNQYNKILSEIEGEEAAPEFPFEVSAAPEIEGEVNAAPEMEGAFSAAPEIEGEEATPEFLFEVRSLTHQRPHITRLPGTFLTTQPSQSEPTQLSQTPQSEPTQPFPVRWVTRQRSHITRQPDTFLTTQPPQSEPTQPSQTPPSEPTQPFLFEVHWVTRQRSHITRQPGTLLTTQPPQSEPTQPSQSDVGISGVELLNIAGQLLEFVQLFSEESKRKILSLIEKKGMEWVKMNVSNAVKGLPQKASACAAVAGDSALDRRTLVFGNNDDDVVIVAVHSIFEVKRGSFKDLLALVLKEVIEKTNVNPSEVGKIVVGTALALGSQRFTECRMAALCAGFPETLPSTVGRKCSSGLQAVADVAADIRNGSYEIGIGAGLEFMTFSQVSEGAEAHLPMKRSIAVREGEPLYLSKNKKGKGLPFLDDGIRLNARFSDLTEMQPVFKDGSTTPGNSSQVSDGAGALLPIKRSIAAQKGLPFPDGGIQPNAIFSDLPEQQPVFKDGSTTAGNSSQVSDSAGAVLLMKRSIAVQKGLPIFGVFKTFVVVPAIMGVDPAVAIPAAVKDACLELDDIDLFVINKAFASQFVDCPNKLELDPKKVIVNGGATGTLSIILKH